MSDRETVLVLIGCAAFAAFVFSFFPLCKLLIELIH